MEASMASLNKLDLTGKVTITNFMPMFTGNYSTVYQGAFEGNIVAVKIIKATSNIRSMQRKILRERTIWASLDHQNIHPFQGFASDPTFGPFGALISPLCARGDACKLLEEHGASMPERERIKLWSGIVDGVAYLHLHNPVIVHGDLKPGNILIDDSGRPRICDFGLSQLFLDEKDTGFTTTSEHTGTERYLAPELVMSESTVYPTIASDIHALGCLGLEFVHLKRPYSHRKNNLRGHIIQDLRRGVPPAPDPEEPWSQLWLIIRACWDKTPNRRPSTITVAQLLKPWLNARAGVIVEINSSHSQYIDDPEKMDVKIQTKNRRLRRVEELDTVKALENRAAAYYQQERWKDAERLQLEALESRTRIQGEMHLSTIAAAENLATTYYKQEQWDDTEKLQLWVIEALTRIQGVEHLSTIAAAERLAFAYFRQERWSHAEKLLSEALEARIRIQGVQYLSTIATAESLAATYGKQERWNDTERLLLGVLGNRIKIQEVEHLDTIATAEHLALAYSKQKEWDDVEALLLKSLEIRTNIQGVEHLDTIITTERLAATYYQQGRVKDAETLRLHIPEGRKRIQTVEELVEILEAGKLKSTYYQYEPPTGVEKL